MSLCLYWWISEHLMNNLTTVRWGKLFQFFRKVIWARKRNKQYWKYKSGYAVPVSRASHFTGKVILDWMLLIWNVYLSCYSAKKLIFRQIGLYLQYWKHKAGQNAQCWVFPWSSGHFPKHPRDPQLSVGMNGTWILPGMNCEPSSEAVSPYCSRGPVLGSCQKEQSSRTRSKECVQ